MRQLIMSLGLLAVFGLAGCGGTDERPNNDAAHTVSLNAAVGGSFDINDQQEVAEGSVLSATVTPDTGYRINTVTGCGGTLTENTYTTAPITEDCTVEADFKVLIVSMSKINDTGIILCGNYDAENGGQWSSTLNCADTGATENSDGIDADGNVVPAGQDAHYGRDALAAAGSLYKVGGGSAGFDFTRINSDGSEYTGNGDYATNPWSCVRDNVTDLIWEVKAPSNGNVGDNLHDADDLYYRRSTVESNSGSVEPAAPNRATCYGYNSTNSSTFCNTEAFVYRVNVAGLCGANDRRMPKKEELRSIVHYGRDNPSIDSDYFPNTENNGYRSGSIEAYFGILPWIINFDSGSDSLSAPGENFRVRLVRFVP